MLPNETWVHLSACSEANLLTLGCDEGKYSAYIRAQKGVSVVHAQKIQTSWWFAGKHF